MSGEPGSQPEGESEVNRIPEPRVKEMVAQAARQASEEAESRMRGQFQSEREARIRLEEQITALKSAPAEPKPATEAELQTLVDDGRISASQMAAELVRQSEARMTKKLEEQITTTVAQTTSSLEQQRVMAKYAEAHPDLAVKGSETNNRLVARFQKLLTDGMPENRATELVALELEFGKPGGPKAVTREARETLQDTATDGGSEGEPMSDAQTTAKESFTSDQYRYYGAKVEQGFYKGWSDPQLQKEAKRAKQIQSRRQRK